MSLNENKAGAAAVDPADFNTVVDAVVVLQTAPGGTPTLAEVLAESNDGNNLRIRNVAEGSLDDDVATVSQLGGGGGGTAGAVVCKDLLFTEVDTAGTYTATLVIPVGGYLLDAFVIPEADVWASTGATLNVGYTGDADGIFSNQALDGGGTNSAYDPVAGGSQSVGNDYLSLGNNGGGAGRQSAALTSNLAASGDAGAPGIPFTAGTTITAEVVTSHEDTVVPTGITRVRLIHTAPSVSNAAFA